MTKYIGTDGWSIISTTRTDEGLTRVMAAKDIDGIGTVVEWRRPYRHMIGAGVFGEWRVASWGCTEDHVGPDTTDDSGCVPEIPPVGVQS